MYFGLQFVKLLAKAQCPTFISNFESSIVLPLLLSHYQFCFLLLCFPLCFFQFPQRAFLNFTVQKFSCFCYCSKLNTHFTDGSPIDSTAFMNAYKEPLNIHGCTKKKKKQPTKNILEKKSISYFLF